MFTPHQQKHAKKIKNRQNRTSHDQMRRDAHPPAASQHLPSHIPLAGADKLPRKVLWTNSREASLWDAMGSEPRSIMHVRPLPQRVVKEHGGKWRVWRHTISIEWIIWCENPKNSDKLWTSSYRTPMSWSFNLGCAPMQPKLQFQAA